MPVTNGVETVLAALEGYVVDFDHPQRQGVPQAYYVAGFGTAISLLFFAQRLYVKVCLAGGLLVDDFLPSYARVGNYVVYLHLAEAILGRAALSQAI
ncbi:integral membrane protein [Ilyonectria robusta]